MAAINPLSDRTWIVSDPVRNFKFQVEIVHTDSGLTAGVAKMGFTAVDGLQMNTEMVPYREGGWNTSPHKLPGQTDFAPLSMTAGVFFNKPGMWNLARQMFSAQWGGGNIGMNEEFRFAMNIRILDHPVTRGAESGTQGSPSGAIMGYHVSNAWVGSVNFGGLNAMDNSVLIHSMTVHHEGFEVLWGPDEVRSLQHAN